MQVARKKTGSEPHALHVITSNYIDLTASFSKALFSGITIAFRKDELQHKWKSESFGSIGTNIVPRLGATWWTKLLEFRNLGCLSSE
jgi:hypothetical protein